MLPLISASTPGLHCEIFPVHTPELPVHAPVCKGLHCTLQIPCASTTVHNVVLHTPGPLCKHNARQIGHPRPPCTCTTVQTLALHTPAPPPCMHHRAAHIALHTSGLPVRAPQGTTHHVAHPRPPPMNAPLCKTPRCTPCTPLCMHHRAGHVISHPPGPPARARHTQPRTHTVAPGHAATCGAAAGPRPRHPSSPCPVPPAPAAAKFSRGPALAQRAAHLAPRHGRLGPRQARRDRSRRG